jgi:hypothetical protein
MRLPGSAAGCAFRSRPGPAGIGAVLSNRGSAALTIGPNLPTTGFVRSGLRLREGSGIPTFEPLRGRSIGGEEALDSQLTRVKFVGRTGNGATLSSQPRAATLRASRARGSRDLRTAALPGASNREPSSLTTEVLLRQGKPSFSRAGPLWPSY